MLEAWLANPMLQSAVLPLLVALFLGLLLQSIRPFGTGLAIMAGFLACVALAVGFAFTPLTSTRKIVLLALACVPVAAALDVWRPSARTLAPALAALGAAAVLWLMWPYLARQSGAQWWQYAAGAVVFGAWMSALFDRLNTDTDRALAGGLGTALATGIAALLSASALLGQLGIALGAAIGAITLLHLLGRSQSSGRLVTLPSGVLCTLIAWAAYIYAKLPWTVLPVLGLIPVVALLPMPHRLPHWLRLCLLCLMTLILAGGAIFLAFREAGGLPV